MKKVVNLILVLLIVFFSSCQKKEKLTIGFLYPSSDIKRFSKESAFFKQYCAAQGVDVIIKTAANDESMEIEMANQLIEQRIDALVLIATNINTADAIVREAHAEGIPVMAYNRMIKNSDIDFFVASNNDIIGKAMVDAVLREKPTGNFVILGGDKFDKNGEELQVAIKKYLKPKIDNKQVNIVYETFIEKWDGDIAAYEMEKVIQLYGNNIDAVIAGFDGMATGVIEVLESHGVTRHIAITGQDAELDACKNVIAGKQTVTIFHPLKVIAEKGAEIAIDMAKGKKLDGFVNSTDFNGLKEVPTHRVNSIPVNKNNIEEVLVGSGFYTRKQLFE